MAHPAHAQTPRERVLALHADQLPEWLFDTFHSPTYVPPMLPRVAIRLLEVTRNPEADIKAVARLLEEDAMLTAVVLRTANSAAHRGSSEIRSIEGAITRMGLRRLTELFVETALNLRTFRAEGYEPAMELLRLHSSATAYTARMLCRFTNEDPGPAFLCGLLHDVGLAAGLIAMSEHFGPSRVPPIQSAWPAVVEHHEAANLLIQQSWGLPAEIGSVMSTHHISTRGQRLGALTATVALADALVTQLGAGVMAEVAPGTTEAAQDALGIDDHILARVRVNAEILIADLGN